MWDEVDLELMVEAAGANVCGVDDRTISPGDGDRSRKLHRTMKVCDIVGSGEGGTGVGGPGNGSWSSRDG